MTAVGGVASAALLLVAVALPLVHAKPLQLFRPNADHTTLLPCDEGLAALAAITKPVAVVSVVGPYRSGKSFLLNQLLGRTDGFELGSSVRPVTMGVWFWADAPTLNNTALILIDTEGLYSPHVPAAYDAKMFALSLIFSSTLVYNELGVLSQQSVDRFQYLSRLTLKFLDKSQDTAADAGKAALTRGGRVPAPNDLDHPNFFWVLEDFNLDLDNQTPEQWLSHFLRGGDSSSSSSSSSAPAHTLSLFGMHMADAKPMFASVNVAMLPFPHYEPEKMRRLDRVASTELLPHYQSQMSAFRTKLLSSAKPKQFAGVALGGKELSGLLRVTVAEMNAHDRFPSIVDTWSLFLNLQNGDAQARALSAYGAAMSAVIETQPPVTVMVLTTRHRDSARDALTLYDRECVPNEEASKTMRAELSTKLETRFQQVAAQHAELVTNFCTRLTSKRVDKFEETVRAYLTTPRPEVDLLKVLDKETEALVTSVICGELCPQSHCTRLREEVANRRARHIAENRLAINDACRGAKTKALDYFLHVGGVELTPILESELVERRLASVKTAALEYFTALAPVAASERATNEYYNTLTQQIDDAALKLRDDNATKRATRYLLGALLPGAVLAVHFLMSVFISSLPLTIVRTYRAKRVALFAVCALGWLFLMFYYDIRYALRSAPPARS